MDEDPRLVSDEVRYTPAAVEDEAWIEAFLERRPVGVLGLVDEGAPYLLAHLYVYDAEAGAVYLHGADDGRANGIVSREPGAPACFTVTEMGRVVPAERPVDFTVEYASVDVFGSVDLLEEAGRKRAVLEGFMAKFAPGLEPGVDYEPIDPASVDRTAVYRIDVEEWSAKRWAEPDNPDAYPYDEGRDGAE